MLSLNPSESKYRLLHSAFLEAAAAHPSRVALRHASTAWTYGMLRDRALAIAASFPEIDDAFRPVVAILGTKSPPSIAAILGALCSGRAYSTIAPASPRARIEASLRVLRPTVLVATGLGDPLREALRGLRVGPAALLDLGGDLPAEAFPEVPRLTVTAAPGEPLFPDREAGAYVLFTSGSTGAPKGACISHRAACAAVDMFLRRHPVEKSDRVGNQVELCFDLSMFDLFGALSCGAELHLLDASASEPSAFFGALALAGVTSVFTVPSVVRQALLSNAAPPLPRLRRLLFSGEPLTVDLLEKLDRHLPSVEIWNLYGGTEMPYVLATRVLPRSFERANTFTAVDPEVKLTFRPLSDRSDGQVVGELVVLGLPVFSGYVDPTSARMPAGTEAHVTGDLFRQEEGGEITILGRKDRQVKIDGVRVELDAIEHLLESHPKVAEAVVVPTSDQLEVIAFVALWRKAPASLYDELADFCREHLLPPECPIKYRLLPCLPRTSTGKKDRVSLEATILDEGYRPGTQRPVRAPQALSSTRRTPRRSRR